ncbi:helix-turn-helix protein [Herbihabitans rhizosphaerae]|uniref:Helix-turn-helix protein n=2 Tax=Herbihabitans rhizosphaerae TaxID=1872711 RepID=A0A4Q7KJC7_9PSEU|nr:helix-turn-helix protein [Herbihabitans rhizosphaerae]
MLAGVGVTWYTWLEQGRSINASSQVLDAVARTLGMDNAEREHLYRLAEATPIRMDTTTTDVPATIQDAVRALDPLPAAVLNSRHDILFSNDAHHDLFADWHTLPCVHKNKLWCCVTEPLARERLLDYDKEVAYLVARLRAEYGRHVGDPAWEEDIRRLTELSDEFAALWSRHEVAPASVRTLRFWHPEAGELTFESTPFTAAAESDLQIQVYTPADDGTAKRLSRTRIQAPA